MLKTGTTIKEATEEWVRGMNAIPTRMIEKLWDESWREITPPAVGDRVYVFFDTKGNGEGEIVAINDDEYKIDLDNARTVTAHEGEFEVIRYDGLPMWGTMWSFEESIDDYWLEKMGGLELMAECGFRIYQSEDYGYFFGIDGAGYDFYENHWIPLYKARGMKWHDED